MDFALKPEVLLLHMLTFIPTRLMNLYMPFTLSLALKMNPVLRIYLYHISNWNSTGEYILISCLLLNGEHRTAVVASRHYFYWCSILSLEWGIQALVSQRFLTGRGVPRWTKTCVEPVTPAACLWCEEQLACSEEFAGFRESVKW